MLSRLQAAAARLTLMLILALAGGQAMAAGSLSIDTLQGEKYGFSFNHPSIDQADQRATRDYLKRATARPAFVKAYADQMAHYAEADS